MFHSEKPVLNCDECGYNASSETVLKYHMTTKHNPKTPEKSRDSNLDDSLKIVSPSEEKREDINMTVCEKVHMKEVHCLKHLLGEDEMAGIHYKMCPAPCDGHPYCQCKL